MSKKTFYRVGDNVTHQGLWYEMDGYFTGFIHDKFDFCANSDLEMEFDEELIGYLSAVETIEDLFRWFTREDLEILQKENYSIHVYETEDYKWYEKFQHWAINQENSILIKTINI